MIYINITLDPDAIMGFNVVQFNAGVWEAASAFDSCILPKILSRGVTDQVLVIAIGISPSIASPGRMSLDLCPSSKRLRFDAVTARDRRLFARTICDSTEDVGQYRP